MTRVDFIRTGILTAIGIMLPLPKFSAKERFNDVKSELYDNISDIVRFHVHDHNTVEVRKQIETEVLDCLYAFVKKHDLPLYENSVRCDETNNTQANIDRNEFKLDVGIKLDATCNFILLSWFAAPSSEPFFEAENLA